jgi:Flp pilus assembly protein TadG
MLIRPRGFGKSSKRTAIAAAEFALVAPFLAVLICGSIEFARAFMVKNILTDAARDGARIGAIPSRNNTVVTNTDVTTDIDNILNDNNIDYTKATITIKVNGTVADVSTANAGDKISVQISISYSDVAWVGTWFLSSTTIETEYLVMMKQG